MHAMQRCFSINCILVENMYTLSIIRCLETKVGKIVCSLYWTEVPRVKSNNLLFSVDSKCDDGYCSSKKCSCAFVTIYNFLYNDKRLMLRDYFERDCRIIK